MLPKCARRVGIYCALVGCFAAGGCRATPVDSTELSPTGQHLEKVGDAYLRATLRLGRPPANLEELKSGFPPNVKAEEILRSPGDGENFEIIWGVELRQLKARGSDVPIIAYEKNGKDGRRHVLRGRNEVLLMTPGQLKAAKVPSGYTFPF
jgi:hypothetical protein